MVGTRPLIMSGQQELEVYNYIVSTVEEEFVLFQLERSLEDDGRFYGAEWVEEYNEFQQFEACLNKYLTSRTLGPVEMVREIRDCGNIDGWISK